MPEPSFKAWSTFSIFFFFNDTATTEIYTLSLHDALPICGGHVLRPQGGPADRSQVVDRLRGAPARAIQDRKSTRLNSSHANISYAVFCLKKKTMDIGACYLCETTFTLRPFSHLPDECASV